MSATISGGCVCGGTRYVLGEVPTHVADCHCLDCRRSSGAAYVTWGVVRRERMKLVAGELRKVPHAERVRDFAACCGTQLFFEDTPDWPTIDVAIATLDDPADFAPTMAIWTEDKLPWVRLDETKPAYRRTPREG